MQIQMDSKGIRCGFYMDFHMESKRCHQDFKGRLKGFYGEFLCEFLWRGSIGLLRFHEDFGKDFVGIQSDSFYMDLYKDKHILKALLWICWDSKRIQLDAIGCL